VTPKLREVSSVSKPWRSVHATPPLESSYYKWYDKICAPPSSGLISGAHETCKRISDVRISSRCGGSRGLCGTFYRRATPAPGVFGWLKSDHPITLRAFAIKMTESP